MPLEIKIAGFKSEYEEDKIEDDGKFIVCREGNILAAYFAGPNTFGQMKHRKVAQLFGIEYSEYGDNLRILGGASYCWYGGGSNLYLTEGSCDFGEIPRKFASDLGEKLKGYLIERGIEIRDVEINTWVPKAGKIKLWNEMGYETPEQDE